MTTLEATICYQGNAPTWTRWSNILNQLGIPETDHSTTLQLKDHPQLQVRRNDARTIDLTYGPYLLIRYNSDITTRFTVSVEGHHGDDAHKVELINWFTPDWFTVTYVVGEWWADIVIGDVAERMPLLYNGQPKVWRRNKLGAKLRANQSRMANQQAETLDASLPQTITWSKLTRAQLEKESVASLLGIADMANKDLDTLEQLAIPRRNARETIRDILDQRTINTQTVHDANRTDPVAPDPFPTDT